MTRLARRLARLRDAAVPVPPAGPVAPRPAPRESPGREVEALRASIRRILERHRAREVERPPAPEPEGLPGELIDTPEGPIRRVVTMHEPHHRHGRAPVAGALAVASPTLAGLAGAPELEACDLRRAVFVDTETTGLAGGTGTIPFLVGLGAFEDESFVVEQLLLDDLAHEPALMARVRDRLASASCLVTFNGKAYDGPLLVTRAVLTRVGSLPPVPHVDLLHLARRSYRRRLGSFRLVDLERRVLGFAREHDIDGAEVPGAYWSFLRSGRPTFLLPVLEHNLHDILALAALLAELGRGYERVDPKDEPEDQLCRALWALRRHDHDRVDAYVRAVADGGAGEDARFEAFMAAATSARRRKDRRAEADWLDRALDTARTPDREVRARLERAKYFEHRARSLTKALEEAKALHRLAPSPEVERRVSRLERRCRVDAKDYPRAVSATAGES